MLECSDQTDRTFDGAFRCRSAAAAVPETMNHVGNVFAVFVLTRQNNDAPVAPEKSCRQNAAVPEGVNNRCLLIFKLPEIFVSVNFPSPRAGDDLNEDPSEPPDCGKIQALEHQAANPLFERESFY